jgi:hypothetical protein
VSKISYLTKYGPKALANGYEIIPIKPGTKRPPFDGWEDIRADERQLDRWIANGRDKHGVGILARRTPLVDIDCHDPGIVEKMIAFTEDLLGPTAWRGRGCAGRLRRGPPEPPPGTRQALRQARSTCRPARQSDRV